MASIHIERNPTAERLQALEVSSWPIWTKEISEFPWHYSESETCYFLAGNAIVTPDGGEPVSMGTGDLVTFPEGMFCTWKIDRAIKKHYSFG